MSKAAINDLEVLIRKLQDQRKTHLDAIAEIDAAFGSLGIKPTKRRGRPRGATKATAQKKVGKKRVAKKARRRKKFKTSGHASVLAFVEKAGKKGVTGSQITKHWNAQGRGAGCYNIIGDLAEAKKLRRQKTKGQKRGSNYVAV